MTTIDDVKVYCFSGFVKHASLVNKVYPLQPGEEGPRASDLAYLVFYAQHRPEKLKKVGAYLLKRYYWDAAKDKRAFHKVTLDILSALIDGCPSMLSYFAIPAVTILSEMAAIGDSHLLTKVAACFIKFCAHYDASLDSDPTFFPLFAALIDRFCEYATPTASSASAAVPSGPDTPDAPDTHAGQETTLSGLEAVKAVAFSPFIFSSTKSEKYASKIIPPLLANIRARAPATRAGTPASSSGGPASTRSAASPSPAAAQPSGTAVDADGISPRLAAVPTTEGIHQRAARDDAEQAALAAQRRLSIFDDLIHENELSAIAVKALQRLARAATASAIAHIVIPIFAYLDAQSRWNNVEYATAVVRAVTAVSTTPTQTILLGQVLTRINSPAFAHKNKLLSILPQLGLGTPCLAISLTDVLDALQRVQAESPVQTQSVLAWLTRTFTGPTGAGARDALATMVPRFSQPSQLAAIVNVLEAHQQQQPSSVIYGLTLDALEPLAPVLDRSDDASWAVRGRIVRVLAAATPTPALNPVVLANMAPRLAAAYAADPAAAAALARAHWPAHPAETARLLRLWQSEDNGGVPGPVARAALDGSRALSPAIAAVVPAVANIANLGTDAAGMAGIDVTALLLVLGGGPAHLPQSGSTSVDRGIIANGGTTVSPGTTTPKSPSLNRQQSVLRFSSMERKTTPDEFHAILSGKHVLERPISLGPGFTMPVRLYISIYSIANGSRTAIIQPPEDLDDVLDSI
ncbi:hypothetical protein BC828DRAFT_379273 [Blastocladiella britannica]|nr:hypothetical protein BC828DRAFT_379273 [Blastocladiella britannica]